MKYSVTHLPSAAPPEPLCHCLEEEGNECVKEGCFIMYNTTCHCKLTPLLEQSISMLSSVSTSCLPNNKPTMFFLSLWL